MRDCLKGPLAAAALLFAAGSAAAFPDATPWDQDCEGCHYESLRRNAAALQLRGLPLTAEPGRRYNITVSLTEPRMRRAGFRLVFSGCNGQTGQLIRTDRTVETEGAKARTTYDGTTLARGMSRASWSMAWQAPDAMATTCRLSVSLQANAANDDLSPLGDIIYVMEDMVEVRAAR